MSHRANMSIQHSINPVHSEFAFCSFYSILCKRSVTCSIYFILESACINVFGNIRPTNRHIVSLFRISITFENDTCFRESLTAILVENFPCDFDILFIRCRKLLFKRSLNFFRHYLHFRNFNVFISREPVNSYVRISVVKDKPRLCKRRNRIYVVHRHIDIHRLQ